tara:strand:- start:10892 stop:11707 length:816 start_codon:yes stop_codon:yes gene_type:complete
MQTRREREHNEAIDALYLVLGKLPTGQQIGDELVERGYARGSPNEHYRFRKKWVAANLSQTDNSSDEPLSDPIARGAALLNRQISAQAEVKLALEKKELNATIERLTLHRDCAIAEKDDALQRVANLEEQQTKLVAQQQAQKDTIQVLTGENKTLKQALKETHKHRQQNDKKTDVQLKQLTHDINTMAELVNTLKDDSEARRQQDGVMLRHYKDTVTKTQKKLDAQSVNVGKLTTENKKLRQSIKQLPLLERQLKQAKAVAKRKPGGGRGR